MALPSETEFDFGVQIHAYNAFTRHLLLYLWVGIWVCAKLQLLYVLKAGEFIFCLFIWFVMVVRRIDTLFLITRVFSQYWLTESGSSED